MEVDRYKDLEKALYTLQKVENLNVHFGGRTALRYIYGLPFYVERPLRVDIFYDPDVVIPNWFNDFDWRKTLNYDSPDFQVMYTKSNFLPKGTGLIDYTLITPSIKVSGYERAVLEFLYGVPEENALILGSELMEMRDDLNPKILQILLEQCPCTTTKRLFLYCSDKWEHEYVTKLDLSKIDLGKGIDTTFFNDETRWGEVSFNKKFNMNIPVDVEKTGYSYESTFYNS